jgi:LacI family transcriptional regulator
VAETAGGNPTLYDVAQAAGVSLATASRALNGSARKVNDSYRDRVLAAAERLGYTPNLSAQAVAKGASNTVALLVSDIADPYFSSIAAGVMREAAAAGLSVTMAVTDRDPEREIELVRVMRGQRPQVIVLAGSRLVDDPGRDALVAELEAFSSAGGRVVAISQKQLPFDTVLIDNRAGAKELARSLVGLGYRRFGILAGPANLMTARDRDDAFRTELRLAGIPVDDAAIVHGGFTRDGGYAAIGELADAGVLDRLEVVFAVNDVMAIGAMAGLRDRGLDVPGAVAIAGYDDIPSARDVSPALTTVHVPLEEAGEKSITLALAARQASPAIAEVTATVTLRGSTPGR